ncbi:MAG: radical SAM protein, partial [Bosea sp.]|uniref:radical SAM protein n=1 Tax=Bosea sp. (in: a-proteobacteria) TaxID=1871050 RepID=UPI0023A36F69|nr:radical SAM protein [Bosea sp. (in: a-proteobacteria)]
MSEPAHRYTFDTLFFEATRRCNLSCPMCMASSNDRELVKRSKREELTTDEIERHILATAKEIGIRIITWSGGEFIVRRDAVELLRRADRYGGTVRVAIELGPVTSAEPTFEEAADGLIV